MEEGEGEGAGEWEEVLKVVSVCRVLCVTCCVLRVTVAWLVACCVLCAARCVLLSFVINYKHCCFY